MNANLVDTRGTFKEPSWGLSLARSLSLRWFSPACATKTRFEVPRSLAKEAVSAASLGIAGGEKDQRRTRGSWESRRKDLEGREGGGASGSCWAVMFLGRLNPQVRWGFAPPCLCEWADVL